MTGPELLKLYAIDPLVAEKSYNIAWHVYSRIIIPTILGIDFTLPSTQNSYKSIIIIVGCDIQVTFKINTSMSISRSAAGISVSYYSFTVNTPPGLLTVFNENGNGSAYFAQEVKNVFPARGAS